VGVICCSMSNKKNLRFFLNLPLITEFKTGIEIRNGVILMRAKVGSRCMVVSGKNICGLVFDRWRARVFAWVIFEDGDYIDKFEVVSRELVDVLKKHDYRIVKLKTRYHIAKVLRRKRDSKRIMDKTIYKKVKTI